MKNIKFFLVFALLLLTQITSGQNYIADETKNDSTRKKVFLTKKNSYPLFSPHIGVGFASGVRVGLMVHATENLSGEISGGYDFANFTSASDEEQRYGIGINYRYSESIPVFVSVLYAQGVRTGGNLRSPKYYYSMNVGYMSLTKNKVFFFSRAGVVLKYYYDRPFDRVQYEGTYLNLDIGIGYTF